jgi:hypothetical protein
LIRNLDMFQQLTALEQPGKIYFSSSPDASGSPESAGPGQHTAESGRVSRLTGDSLIPRHQTHGPRFASPVSCMGNPMIMLGVNLAAMACFHDGESAANRASRGCCAPG